MRQRCNDPKHISYKYYGAKGIRVDPRWNDFSNFFEDMKPTWAPGLMLDRKDSKGHYNKENCRWATSVDQNNNKSNNHRVEFRGEILTLGQWANRLGLGRGTIHHRLCYLGWSVCETLTTPGRAK